MKKHALDIEGLCEVGVSLSVLEGRWKCIVLFYLWKEPQRFGQLKRLIGQVAPRMLTLQLRELEEDGLITRSVLNQVSAYVEYRLTPLGRAFAVLLPPCAIGAACTEKCSERKSAAEDNHEAGLSGHLRFPEWHAGREASYDYTSDFISCALHHCASIHQAFCTRTLRSKSIPE
ncbi:winged helix-turn-helix transcriptional regulator [Deinococcus hopiensis]|uniref:Transcriptional regulator, HxlR family n=1 Tax=Deinococcus hopiensis KR-140 TaxID=695939 RepID=A0A1W1USE5_9DEIO|nr:helix-turn-helix domain-containing protein [Deinococcus hopiensis]SMB84017.1 transcriptional regulator, HxlR family [Deinococcus hopiensis KR-140]